MTSTEQKPKDDNGKEAGDKPANAAPDAVMDPNEKTGGKPGLPPGAEQGDDADPGGG